MSTQLDMTVMSKSNRLQIVTDVFEEAFTKFIAKEGRNASVDISERCLCGRLSIYLEQAKDNAGLKEYFSDVEYNRGRDGSIKVTYNLGNTKYMPGIKVIPINCDLILHSRGEINERDNLIAIEMKKLPADKFEVSNDKLRLKALTLDVRRTDIQIHSGVDLDDEERSSPEVVCGYDLGVMMLVDWKAQIVTVYYYVNGSEKKDARKEVRFA